MARTGTSTDRPWRTRYRRRKPGWIRHYRYIKLTFYFTQKKHVFLYLGDSNQLELDGPMYLGGMSPPFTDIVPPPALWTAVLRQGYVGCLRDFNVNNKPVDIAGFARQQDSGNLHSFISSSHSTFCMLNISHLTCYLKYFWKSNLPFSVYVQWTCMHIYRY